MLLKLGDAGDLVKDLQRGLNKVGSILLVDGDFGPATRDAVVDARLALREPASPEADDALQESIALIPDPFPFLTAPGLTFIARAEVSGPNEYRRKYQHPVWPSKKSGITIGIGYDLQFVDRDQLSADWEEHLPPAAIARLAEVTGMPGWAEGLAQVQDIDVPLLAAISVFIRRSLPTYVQQTCSIYPETVNLTPARRTSLVSLVYNRGARLVDSNPALQERREMRNIRELLASGEFASVAAELDSMARLWDLPGLIQRRHDEARLWRSDLTALQLN
jgi:peptidoglycan hydrolase-like protein with peptidoglycan-binding domain